VGGEKKGGGRRDLHRGAAQDHAKELINEEREWERFCISNILWDGNHAEKKGGKKKNVVTSWCLELGVSSGSREEREKGMKMPSLAFPRAIRNIGRKKEGP